MEWGIVDAEQMRQLAEYRASGLMSRVEVMGDSQKCSYCRSGFEGIHDINEPLIMPPAQCDHEYGFCVACWSPVIDDDDTEIDPIPEGESREYDAGDLIMVVENRSGPGGVSYRYSLREKS